MMKKYRLIYLLLTAWFFTGIYSCAKTSENSSAQGGLLPTNYISIHDSSFTPSVLTVANGSSITFLNKTSIGHTVVSADSSTIVSPVIASSGSYYVKPDTIAGSAPVNIYYHCKEHPNATGTIILRP